LDEFIEAINVSRPSLIRTESDELTYPFHVYIRYMIEKKIFSEVVNFEQLNEY
jgi:carboxypeptidase Taq